MFAIVEACGRQYQLEAGRFIDLDLQQDHDDAFVFENVLMIVDGANSTMGAPFIQGAKVKGRVLKHHKGPKIIVYHQKPKKGTRKKQGHRSHLTRVVIDTIELNDKVLAKAEDRQAKQDAQAAAPAKKAAAPKAEKAAKPAAEAKAPKANKAEEKQDKE